jgi:hypothetical protein
MLPRNSCEVKPVYYRERTRISHLHTLGRRFDRCEVRSERRFHRLARLAISEQNGPHISGLNPPRRERWPGRRTTRLNDSAAVESRAPRRDRRVVRTVRRRAPTRPPLPLRHGGRRLPRRTPAAAYRRRRRVDVGELRRLREPPRAGHTRRSSQTDPGGGRLRAARLLPRVHLGLSGAIAVLYGCFGSPMLRPQSGGEGRRRTDAAWDADTWHALLGVRQRRWP